MSLLAGRSFLDCLCKLTGSDGGGFLHHDLLHQQFTLRAVGGVSADPALMAAYNTHYGSQDPWRAPYLARYAKTGEAVVLNGDELVPLKDLRKTEIYNDLLLRNKVVHPLIVPGLLSPALTENVTLWRSEQAGPAAEDTVQMVKMLQPHLRTSLMTLHTLHADGWQARSAQAMLDHMHQAVFLLDEVGRVRHMNEAAVALIRRSDALTMQGGLLAASARRQAELEAMVKRATLLAQTDHQQTDQASGSSAASGSGGSEVLPLERSSGKRPYTARALPLRLEKVPFPAHVLLIVTDSGAVPTVSHAALRTVYGATPTESAIANGLLAGRSVAEIAKSRRISEDTTRTHLKTLFQRTGTGRQSELLLLLMQLPRSFSDA